MSENQKTILVVEDQNEISASMLDMLTRKGYRVLHALDADAAITAAEQNQPNMILTDFDLPTFEPLMERLRAHETLKNIRVAVIDINHPLTTRTDVKVVNNLDEMDDLIRSTSQR